MCCVNTRGVARTVGYAALFVAVVLGYSLTTHALAYSAPPECPQQADFESLVGEKALSLELDSNVRIVASATGYEAAVTLNARSPRRLKHVDCNAVVEEAAMVLSIALAERLETESETDVASSPPVTDTGFSLRFHLGIDVGSGTSVLPLTEIEGVFGIGDWHINAGLHLARGVDAADGGAGAFGVQVAVCHQVLIDPLRACGTARLAWLSWSGSANANEAQLGVGVRLEGRLPVAKRWALIAATELLLPLLQPASAAPGLQPSAVNANLKLGVEWRL